MAYALAEFLTDRYGNPVPYGMIPIFCFILHPGSRLRSAVVYSRWGGVDERELFSLTTKWKDAEGGGVTPIASIDEAVAYVKRDAA